MGQDTSTSLSARALPKAFTLSSKVLLLADGPSQALRAHIRKHATLDDATGSRGREGAGKSAAASCGKSRHIVGVSNALRAAPVEQRDSAELISVSGLPRWLLKNKVERFNAALGLGSRDELNSQHVIVLAGCSAGSSYRCGSAGRNCPAIKRIAAGARRRAGGGVVFLGAADGT